GFRFARHKLSLGACYALNTKFLTGPDAVNVIVLYALQEIPASSVLCQLTLDGYKHFSDQGGCELCAAHVSAVQIHTSSYLIGLQPEEAVPLTPEFFDQQRDFLQRWGKVPGVLRVHYDDPNEATGRHHAFYIDVGTLLNAPGFQDEVRAACAQFNPKPDVIVIADHPAARKLGEILRNFLALPLVVLDEKLIARGDGPIDANLHGSRCALIVDDVFITGSRLQSMNRFLREQFGKRAPKLENIHYWTVLATPASPAMHQRVVRGMTANHAWSSNVTHLHSIPLPDWHDANHCPWCMETNVLSGLAQSVMEFDGQIVDRLSWLSSTAQGVVSDPFFAAHSGTPIPLLGANAVALTEGSSAMQVLFAYASAVQQLRNASKNALNADQFPTPRYMARRVFETNYTERLIWLAMLRSLKGKELEPALKTFLALSALNLQDGQHGIVSGELGVAWLTGKLGAIPVSDVSRDFFSGLGISWEALYAKALVDR
ncbi:phosphoribosyltransferase, partial [Burkholderia cepacia]|uniref:phosphoribosyltransferase n=1 Tax=Burkholderia cepacia TaxID=292 RepID=UPI000AB08392